MARPQRSFARLWAAARLATTRFLRPTVVSHTLLMASKNSASH